MAKGKRPFIVKDIFRHRTLSALTVTPDRRLAAFAVAQPDLKENDGKSEVWAWSRDRGTWQVTFGGKSQLYVMGFGLSEGHKVTDFEHVSSVAWTPAGKRLVYTACPIATINSQ